MGKLSDIVADKSDIRGVHGNVAAHAPHSDAHMGFFQSGSVIDAVADHADHLSGALQPLDFQKLILRQTVGMNLRQPHLGANGNGSFLMVACQQHRHHSGGMDLGNGFSGVGTQGVRQRQCPRQFTAQRQINDRTAFFAPLFRGLARLRGKRNVQSSEKRFISSGHLMPFHCGGHSLSRNHLKLLGLGKLLGSPLPVGGNHRFSQGMFRTKLHSSSQSEQPLLRAVGKKGDDMAHLKGTAGEGAGFVKGNVGYTSQPLQCVSFPHQKAVSGGIADGRHNGGGGSQYQSTGTKDNQDSNRPNDFSCRQPGEGCGSEGGNHDPGGPPVRHPHDLRFAGVGGLNQPDHPLDGAVLTNPQRFHLEGTEPVDCTAGNSISRRFIHRKGFPCHYRLVDGSASRKDHTIHRNTFPGKDPKQIAYLYLLCGDSFLSVGGDPSGGAGSQAHQLFDACPGFRYCQILQQRSQLHDESHFSRGKILTDEHRSDESQGNQDIGLDVKGSNQADDSFQDNGDTAKNNCCPRRIKR